jgi:DNA-binding MarR family transcriptional regulator
VAFVEFQAKGDPGPAFHALAFQLSSIGFAVSSRFKAVLAPFDIEPRQFSLLRAVGFVGGQSQKALAERLNVPTSSMVSTVDDLEARGLIERRSSAEDRRVKELHLTQKGKDLLQEVLPVAMDTELKIRNALGADDSVRLAEMLQTVGALFGVTPGLAHSSMQQGKECPAETEEPLG